MEPFNRPYVDPDTEPGDAGTEPWAEGEPGDEDADGDGPLADGGAETDEQGAIAGSPADVLNDGDAIEAANDDE